MRATFPTVLAPVLAGIAALLVGSVVSFTAGSNRQRNIEAVLTATHIVRVLEVLRSGDTEGATDHLEDFLDLQILLSGLSERPAPLVLELIDPDWKQRHLMTEVARYRIRHPSQGDLERRHQIERELQRYTTSQ